MHTDTNTLYKTHAFDMEKKEKIDGTSTKPSFFVPRNSIVLGETTGINCRMVL